MAETKTRTRRASQAERRSLSEKKLIEAALSLAVEDGMPGVTFDAIGAKAGYSRGLASQKFGSKRGLIRAVIDHLHEERQGEENEANLHHATGSDQLMAYVKRHFDRLSASKEGHAYFVFLSGAIGELSDMRALFAEAHESSKRRMVELIRRGQEDGSIRKLIDAEPAALMVGSLLLGAAMAWLTDPGMDIVRVRDETLAILQASFSTDTATGTWELGAPEDIGDLT